MNTAKNSFRPAVETWRAATSCPPATNTHFLGGLYAAANLMENLALATKSARGG